jgi:hypothetical protein
MRDDKNAQTFVCTAIDHRVREAPERMDAERPACRCTEIRVLHQQRDDSLELREEGSRQGNARSFLVESRCIRQLLLGLRMQE